MVRIKGVLTGATDGVRRRIFQLVAVVILGGTFLSTSLRAQPQVTAGRVSVGLQAGSPGGVTSKFYRSNRIAYDAVFTTDGNDFVTLHLHRLWERPLSNSFVRVYAGPGLLVEGRELGVRPTPQAGLSGEIGLAIFIERFEVFIHATPAARLVPNQWARLGGSIGLRFRL